MSIAGHHYRPDLCAAFVAASLKLMRRTGQAGLQIAQALVRSEWWVFYRAFPGLLLQHTV
jgi:hypothetical protein